MNKQEVTDLALELSDIDEVQVEDSDLTNEENTLLARIPLLAGHNKKAAYLAYRSCGFTVGQACDLANTTKTSIQQWRKSDKVFKRFEEEELANLQSTVGNDVIRFEFMRNMRMLLKGDMTLIAKGITDLANMTPREYELFKALRRFYTPADMLALEKILHPEKHQDTSVTIKLSWGGRIEAPQLTTPDVEGEFIEVDNGYISSPTT